LQEWQNSSGSLWAYINGSGNFISTNGASVAGNLGGVANFVVYGTASNARVSQVIQQGSSQTGDALRVLNSSSTVLTSITTAGTINFASGNTSATATAGSTTAPALVQGFIEMQIAGTTVKVPYYAA
jgi:hypothetical protein